MDRIRAHLRQLQNRNSRHEQELDVDGLDDQIHRLNLRGGAYDEPTQAPGFRVAELSGRPRAAAYELPGHNYPYRAPYAAYELPGSFAPSELAVPGRYPSFSTHPRPRGGNSGEVTSGDLEREMQRQRDEDDTANDEAIARLLSQEDSPSPVAERDEQEREWGPFDDAHNDQIARELDELASNERLDAAIALAIADSLDEIHISHPPGGDSLFSPVAPRRVVTAPPECSICTFSLREDTPRDQEDEDDGAGGEGVFTTPCAHTFHVECIRPWFQNHPDCPNCRQPVDQGFVQDVLGSAE